MARLVCTLAVCPRAAFVKRVQMEKQQQVLLARPTVLAAPHDLQTVDVCAKTVPCSSHTPGKRPASFRAQPAASVLDGHIGATVPDLRRFLAVLRRRQTVRLVAGNKARATKLGRRLTQRHDSTQSPAGRSFGILTLSTTSNVGISPTPSPAHLHVMNGAFLSTAEVQASDSLHTGMKLAPCME